MAMMPVLIAFGNMAIRELRELDFIMIPFYCNMINLAIGTAVCLSNGKGFFPAEIDEQGVFTFLLIALVCNGISSYAAWQLKIVAYSSDRVTRVSPIAYMETPFALLYDILVFKTTFSTM